MIATSLQRLLYRKVFKPIAFRFDPEDVHDRVLAVGKRLGSFRASRAIVKTRYRFDHPSLSQTILGITFPNPIGLTAGFDKNAELIDILPSVGFGFVEVGSITGEPSPGNPKPRLWRMPNTRALVVHYGLKNDGAECIATRLEHRSHDIPLGISIARTNSPSTVEENAGIADYVKAFRLLAPHGDDITVNVSCPNTCGGEPFTSPENLHRLLTALDELPANGPIFVKLPADLTPSDLNALASVMDKHRVHGVILSNLTKDRSNPNLNPQELQRVGPGGISGKPVADRSTNLIRHLFSTHGQRFVIIGVGGIFSARDAYTKIRAGASLVQLATGMIFEGPQLIGELNRDLVTLLNNDGFSSLKEAVGTDAKTTSP